MRTRTAGLVAIAAMLFIFVLGGVQRDIDARMPAAAWLPIGAAEAAVGTCPVPSLADVGGDWIVRSAKCTGPDCARAHLAPGDRLRFARDVSGEASFSLDVAPAATARRARTEGYTLRSDGVAGLKGPIVLDHDPLDGSPLDLHWLIVQLRSYDADGLGDCRLAAHIRVCSTEPGSGATTCGPKQHDGVIVATPP